jgi:hypothetical protein
MNTLTARSFRMLSQLLDNVDVKFVNLNEYTDLDVKAFLIDSVRQVHGMTEESLEDFQDEVFGESCAHANRDFI